MNESDRRLTPYLSTGFRLASVVMSNGWSIGEVARRGGVGVETLRYYERRGLIEEPPRKPSGYRHYPPQVVPRLRFIRRAKDLGFSLVEIAELLALRSDSTAPCDDVRRQIEGKISDVDRRIADLRDMKRALVELEKECEGSDPAGECPILDLLEERSS